MGFSARAPPPPRDLNVQSFARSRSRELESLHAVVAARSNHQYRIPRGKKRRTTSFDSRIAKKRRRRGKRPTVEEKEEKGDEQDGKEEEEKKPCRRVRRRMDLRGNPDSGFAASADGTRRLRTHLWHAKRFAMAKRWGFFFPLGLHGKGRGSRAVLRWVKTGTAVHDASYCCPIELQGPQDSLLSVLKKVLFPSPLDLPEKESRPIIGGARYGNALLHHIGVPNSQFVAPVTYMWRPFSGGQDDVEVEIAHVSDGCLINEGNNEKSAPFQNNNEKNTPSRQIWIWLHAAAFNEGFDALRSACIRQTNDSGITISCISLVGQLAEFEIMGHKATESLQKLLHPSQEPISGPDSVIATSSNFRYTRLFILENINYIPTHAILSLKVRDPRDLPSERMKDVSKYHFIGPDIDTEAEDFNQPQFAVDGDSSSIREAIQSLWLEAEDGGTSLADSKDLWAFCDKISPPRKEDIVCLEKHNRRLMQFCMNKDVGTLGHAPEEGTADSCPVLLIRHKDLKIGTRWSIVLPLKWAKALWIPLVSSGAHATGLRERRWIASDNGLPSYPFDFPDCKAYSVMMTSEAAAFDKAAVLQPRSVRSGRIPIPPPWDCLRCSVQKGNHIWEDYQTDSNRSDPHFGLGGGVGDLDSRYCYASSPGQDGLFSSFFVLRAWGIFHRHLKTDDSTSLDPGNMERTVLREFTEKIDLNWISKMYTLMPGNGNLCLLRVLLCSFKEGSFEDGAVVCAPTFEDILLWTSRSAERTKLQIPQMQSYFMERKPGQWELQMPETPSVNQSFRWPIGFVTAGFVRGSSRPVAEAFCEATLLAKLRRQQKDKMQEKSRSEIFVLVRNLRSTAYRLALATIVLENQKEDFDFM